MNCRRSMFFSIALATSSVDCVLYPVLLAIGSNSPEGVKLFFEGSLSVNPTYISPN